MDRLLFVRIFSNGPSKSYITGWAIDVELARLKERAGDLIAEVHRENFVFRTCGLYKTNRAHAACPLCAPSDTHRHVARPATCATMNISHKIAFCFSFQSTAPHSVRRSFSFLARASLARTNAAFNFNDTSYWEIFGIGHVLSSNRTVIRSVLRVGFEQRGFQPPTSFRKDQR